MRGTESTNKEQAVNQLHETEKRWFAVYTRFRREKLVVRRLEERGIEMYVPLQRLVRRYTRKVKLVELPLISCYVFAHIIRKEYVPVLEDPDVVQFVRFNKNLIAIPESEIDILRRVVGEDLSVEAEPLDNRGEVGDEVELIGGQLTGLRGILVEREGNKRVVIELNNLGYALRMEVPPEMLNVTRKNVRRSGAGQTGRFDKE